MALKPCALKPLLAYHQMKHPIDWVQTFDVLKPLVLEIGFGMGEVLHKRALDESEKNFIGIEQHWERIYKTMGALSRDNRRRAQRNEPLINNVRILRVEAKIGLKVLFEPRSLDQVYSLFPCPWPKKGHAKHRLFNRGTLSLINNRLKDGGFFMMVTDHYPYFEWVRHELTYAGFEILEEEVAPQYGTKFERKWCAQGQNTFYKLKGHKKTHCEWHAQEARPLKSYLLKSFDIQRFHFNDHVGEDVSVVLKETLFDSLRQKVLLRFIVAEPDLTQHFLVSIALKENGWRLCKADGQSFFPTPGIAQALECVYQAAQTTCGVS